MAVEITQATTEAQYQAIRELTAEYIAWDADQTAKLGLDPQDFLAFYYGDESEILPGEFAPPRGCLLLAAVDGQPAGCIGYRPFSEQVCVLKRLYVRPPYRGKGIGRLLAVELLEQARLSGYRKVRLETVSFMPEAHQLYQSLGFKFCPPYYEIPESQRAITDFMELQFHESGKDETRGDG
jgi:GNAT superfamily N-acetyltransferase